MPSNNLITALVSVTLVILLLITAMIFVVVVARRQGISQQLKEATYKNRLNEVMLASLRAQMNPHFIFNCLNSIKLYTEQDNSAAASEYLSKFSRLIRNMLDNARVESTTLAAEVQTLELYLDMEGMRFKDKMTYEIIMNNELDTEFIEIPPLLIQPYVENAIWHGIMHKDGPGKVTITIVQDDDTELIITVTDDGIGRDKARKLKSGRDMNHRSYGTQITGERIDLLNESNRALASVSITDLYTPAYEPAGTKVTIILPLK